MNHTIGMLEFKNIEIIYEGKRTSICRAQNRQGERRILKAMKNMNPTPEQLARFEYEYNLLHEIDDPGIIRVFELFKHYRGHIMIMEDVEGIPLFAAPAFLNICDGDLSLPAERLRFILGIFREMTRILGRVHDRGLIHKDINPANFLFLPDNYGVKLLGFGLATKLEPAITELRHIHLMERTLAYMSPEQTGRLNRSLDYRTDFYSLGVSFYELITGKKPFTTDNPMELIHCHIAEIPVPAYMVNPDIPKTVSDIIMRLLEKTPEQRYQSASGIEKDLSRCLEQLSILGTVEDFAVGVDDVSKKLQISKKIYGKEIERDLLTQMFVEVADGASRLLLVGGYAGVGKSAVIRDMHQPVAEQRGFFASGKSEQYQKNVPYYAILQAAKELISKLLQKPDERLVHWREHLVKELGTEGRLLTEMIPELEILIGTQPEVKELNPAENRNRFWHTFGNFFKVFADKQHPLTLFLDDLQWCDQASMEFIRYLLSREDMESFLLIGCYRDNELMESHSLFDLLEDLHKMDKSTGLTIKPLEQRHVGEMIADTLQRRIDEVQPLSEIIYKKTQGNPFFAHKLLLHLYSGQLIYFNEDRQLWEWDLKKIESSKISDNVVEFMIGRIMELSSETRDMLKLASLLGNSFDLEMLSVIADAPVSGVAETLREAVEAEIIYADYDGYDMVYTLETMKINVGFRFVHDQVQQACYVLIEEEERKRQHLKIGRLMKQHIPEEEWKDRVIDIVGHLNEGLEWIDNPDERWETVKFNLWVCRKAKASSSFDTALQFIRSGVELLPDNAWEIDYKLTFESIKMYAECAYLNNDYTLAEEQSQILLRYARTPIEQAEVRLMQIGQFMYQGQFEQALQCGLLGLRLLGFRIPFKPSLFAVIKEMMMVRARLFRYRKDIEMLVHLPEMQNEHVKLALRILLELNRFTYQLDNPNLFLLVILKGMHLTLQYGYSPEAASVYSAYSAVMVIIGNLRDAYDFCSLALRLSEREECAQWRPSILFSYGYFGHAWSRSWQDAEQWFKKSAEEALKYGEHYFVSYGSTFRHTFHTDMNVKLMAQKSMKLLPLIRQTNNQHAYYLLVFFIHKWLNYAGLTDERFALNMSPETLERNGGIGIVFNEKEYVNYMQQTNSHSGLGVYYTDKMYIHYFYEDYSGAWRYLEESDKYAKYHIASPYMVHYREISFLVLAANIPNMTKTEAGKAWRRLRKEYKQIRKLAKYCPANFEHLQYLLEAELARLDHNIYRAAEKYEQAIQTARQNSFVRDEALANELAAKMFLEHNRVRMASYYMMEAFQLYQLWGAEAKTSHMAENYGHLLEMSWPHSERLGTPVSETASTVETFDLMAIVTAYQAVSREVELSHLLQKIIKLVVENSGAQKAYIILKSEQGWMIEAERLPSAAEIRVLQSAPLEEAEALLCKSVVNYSLRTGEAVVLRDAVSEGSFRNDPYIEKNGIRSVLCMPIMNQRNLSGIMYLENNLSPNAFTKDRIHILELLSAQFSISIQNVQLYADLEKWNQELEVKVAERTHDLEEANRKLEVLSSTDGLTGVANRRHLDLVSESEWRRASRGEYSLAFILLDVDYFKKYNDRYGHLSGDECLRKISGVLKKHAQRDSDLPARYGGEEFAVVLPNTPIEEAHLIAEKIRHSVEELAEPHIDSPYKIVTISVGVAVCIPSSHMKVEMLFHQADEALYQAKSMGRNKVVNVLVGHTAK